MTKARAALQHIVQTFTRGLLAVGSIAKGLLWPVHHLPRAHATVPAVSCRCRLPYHPILINLVILIEPIWFFIFLVSVSTIVYCLAVPFATFDDLLRSPSSAVVNTNFTCAMFKDGKRVDRESIHLIINLEPTG
jgi:hypothetical protein